MLVNTLLTIIRVLLGRGKRALAELKQEAAIRQRLFVQQPTLRASLGAGAKVDVTSTIGVDAIIDAHVTVWQSKIGNQVILQAGAAVVNSTLGDRVSIGKHAVLEQSVLHHNVRLEPRASIYHSTLQPFVLIHGATVLRNSQVQSYSYIGSNCSLEHTSVGKFCSIAQNLICAPGNHPTHMLSTSPAFYLTAHACGTTFATEDAYDGRAPCTIGNDVWIGANVFIKGGTIVGDGAIIAAGSVVVKDVAPYAIVGGVPAKEIRKRFSDQDIATLQRLQWWDWTPDVLRQATTFIQQGNIQALAGLGARTTSAQSDSNCRT